MTTLAGAVPRMMRPGPGQNYPRSGFPLEGMSGPQPIRIPRPGIGGRTPILVSRALSPALSGASSLGTSHPKKQKWGGDLVGGGGCRWSMKLFTNPWSLPGLLLRTLLCPVVLELPRRGRWTSFAAPEASSLSVLSKLLRSCSGGSHF